MSVDPTFKAWFTTAEAAQYTGYSVRSIEQAVATGVLKSAQRAVRGPRRFHRDDLDAFVRGEPTLPLPAVTAARTA